MSSHLRLSLFRRAIPFLVLALAPACAPHRADPAIDHSSDEAEIRAAMRASANAWNRGDLRGHLAIYVDSVTFMTKSGPRPGVQAIEEAFARTYFRDGQPKQALDFSQLTVRFLGRDAALVNGHFQLSGGGEPDQSGWFTLIWIRTATGWKAMHDHSS
jgi:uncharacterized protein (TIGR02246 family)